MSAGLRLSITRGDADPDGTYVYRGAVELAGASFGLEARVSAADAILTWAATPPADQASVEKTVRALVRAATRAEIHAGRPPPRRVTRWREA